VVPTHFLHLVDRCWPRTHFFSPLTFHHSGLKDDFHSISGVLSSHTTTFGTWVHSLGLLPLAGLLAVGAQVLAPPHQALHAELVPARVLGPIWSVESPAEGALGAGLAAQAA